MTMRTKFLIGTLLTIYLLPLTAQAHWCNDLWSSAYNIVVRPASDTVTVPASGSGSLDIFVQNNMGYQLTSFKLTATMASGTITATRKTQKVANILLPGEKATYTLAITKSGGGDVAVGGISFSVSFGNSGQSGLYPAGGGKAVMIRQSSGTLVPTAPPPGVGSGVDQARQLQYAALADFSNVDTGLDKLMGFYCAGRGSWGANDATVITTACSGTATDCTKATRSTAGTGSGTKYDYTKLWAAVELAARKSALGTRLAALRTRLQCGAADKNVGSAGVALMVLGYLGEDAGARSFLEGKVGTDDIGTIAKAALMLMSAADVTKYEADVKAGLSKGGFVAASCAAALGIAKLDDATVTSTLVPLLKWSEPDTDNGAGLYPAHMLALTAWSRRGWAANAGDTGAVTFYEGGTPTPTGGTPSTGGSTGAGGTTGAAGSVGAGGTTSGGGGTRVGGSVATGGKTGTASGGGTLAATGGSAETPTGGSAVTPTGGSVVTPTGGSVVTPTGGSAATPTGGTPETPTGGSVVTPTGGGQATGGNPATGGKRGEDTGGQAGNSGSASDDTAAHSGSAGGCSLVPSGRATIPLGFLLVGVGLALAVRRRRR